MVEAYQTAKMIGSVPAGMDRIIEKALKPRINWRAEISDWFQSRDKTDYSFSKPNNRFSMSSCIMPSLYGESAGKLVFAVDCSGSVSQRELQQIGSEILDVSETIEPEEMIILWFDTKIYPPQRFDRGDLQDLQQLKPKGGGGTRFHPIFDWMAENEGDGIEGLIILSDGYAGLSNLQEPECPVLWAITEDVNDFKPPFGHVVECKIEGV